MDSTLCFKHSSLDGGEKSLAQKPLAALHISLHFSSYFQIEDFSLVTKPIALSGAGFFTKFMSLPFILISCNTFSSMFSSFKSPKAGENYFTPWLLCKTCCTFLSLVLSIIHICVWLSTHQPTDPLVIWWWPILVGTQETKWHKSHILVEELFNREITSGSHCGQ